MAARFALAVLMYSASASDLSVTASVEEMGQVCCVLSFPSYLLFSICQGLLIQDHDLIHDI